MLTASPPHGQKFPHRGSSLSAFRSRLALLFPLAPSQFRPHAPAIFRLITASPRRPGSAGPLDHPPKSGLRTPAGSGPRGKEIVRELDPPIFATPMPVPRIHRRPFAATCHLRWACRTARHSLARPAAIDLSTNGQLCADSGTRHRPPHASRNPSRRRRIRPPPSDIMIPSEP